MSTLKQLYADRIANFHKALKKAQLLIELRDGRFPMSSFNHHLVPESFSRKRRAVILSRDCPPRI